jgi:3-dehydroquinate dehydratase/shikimate dehydrogenase
MICISIAQESRTLALADMLNAVAMGADLIELRLDTFENAPNFSDLIGARRKPVIFTCRRSQDGGNWAGTEDERLALLRQAVVSKADYVEVELDAADAIRPYPGCKRVISYTNLKETPANIDTIYAQMQTKKPDIIKITCRARTPEEAWPLVKILAKPPVPTVVVGLGRPGLMLAVLGRRHRRTLDLRGAGAGMEAYPGQPTVSDLENVYHYRQIEASTRFLGVTGLGEKEFLTTAALNAAFAAQQSKYRVLPLQIGNLEVFKRIATAVKLPAVLIDDDHQGSLREILAGFDGEAERLLQADMIYQQGDGWRGVYTLSNAVVNALHEAAAKLKPDSPEPMRGLGVMLYGTKPMVRALATVLKERGAAVMLCSKDKNVAQTTAQRIGCRYVPFEALYTTLHDVLVVVGDPGEVEEELEESSEGEAFLIKPGYLRAQMIVLDLTSMPRRSPFALEARLRGCTVVEPRQLLAQQIHAQLTYLMGEQAPSIEPIQQTLATMLADEDEVGEYE